MTRIRVVQMPSDRVGFKPHPIRRLTRILPGLTGERVEYANANHPQLL